MKIKDLKKKIEEQKEENIRLFKIFEYKMHEEEMQPILQQWREGSKKIKSMINKLYEMEKEEKKSSLTTTKEENKTFVNGFGEATKREIMCNSYKRSEDKMAKQIMSFIGVR